MIEDGPLVPLEGHLEDRLGRLLRRELRQLVGQVSALRAIGSARADEAPAQKTPRGLICVADRHANARHPDLFHSMTHVMSTSAVIVTVPTSIGTAELRAWRAGMSKAP